MKLFTSNFLNSRSTSGLGKAVQESERRNTFGSHCWPFFPQPAFASLLTTGQYGIHFLPTSSPSEKLPYLSGRFCSQRHQMLSSQSKISYDSGIFKYKISSLGNLENGLWIDVSFFYSLGEDLEVVPASKKAKGELVIFSIYTNFLLRLHVMFCLFY